MWLVSKILSATGRRRQFVPVETKELGRGRRPRLELLRTSAATVHDGENPNNVTLLLEKKRLAPKGRHGGAGRRGGGRGPSLALGNPTRQNVPGAALNQLWAERNGDCVLETRTRGRAEKALPWPNPLPNVQRSFFDQQNFRPGDEGFSGRMYSVAAGVALGYLNGMISKPWRASFRTPFSTGRNFKGDLASNSRDGSSCDFLGRRITRSSTRAFRAWTLGGDRISGHLKPDGGIACCGGRSRSSFERAIRSPGWRSSSAEETFPPANGSKSLQTAAAHYMVAVRVRARYIFS